jgi:hypothetical protein
MWGQIIGAATGGLFSGIGAVNSANQQNRNIGRAMDEFRKQNKQYSNDMRFNTAQTTAQTNQLLNASAMGNQNVGQAYDSRLQSGLMQNRDLQRSIDMGRQQIANLQSQRVDPFDAFLGATIGGAGAGAKIGGNIGDAIFQGGIQNQFDTALGNMTDAQRMEFFTGMKPQNNITGLQVGTPQMYNPNFTSIFE